MQKNQLRELITEVLTDADLYSDSARELLMLVAATESKLGYYIRQIKGPARGIFQIEPATEQDIHERFLSRRPELAKIVASYQTGKDDLKFNLGYQILMARIFFLRFPEPLPDASDTEALAKLWKDRYNTYLGAGKIEEAIEAYNKYAV